jgi:hypothetical protein
MALLPNNRGEGATASNNSYLEPENDSCAPFGFAQYFGSFGCCCESPIGLFFSSVLCLVRLSSTFANNILLVRENHFHLARYLGEPQKVFEMNSKTTNLGQK